MNVTITVLSSGHVLSKFQVIVIIGNRPLVPSVLYPSTLTRKNNNFKSFYILCFDIFDTLKLSVSDLWHEIILDVSFSLKGSEGDNK